MCFFFTHAIFELIVLKTRKLEKKLNKHELLWVETMVFIQNQYCTKTINSLLIILSYISHPNFQPTDRIQWAIVFCTLANFQPTVVGVKGVHANPFWQFQHN